MDIYLFEDNGYRKLLPLVYFRPVYDLRCGILTLREKVEKLFPDANIYYDMRDYLSETFLEKNPHNFVNKKPVNAAEVFLVNGRTLASTELSNVMRNLDLNTLLLKDNSIIAGRISTEYFDSVIDAIKQNKLQSSDFPALKFRELSSDIAVIEYSWELVLRNGDQIGSDFRLLFGGRGMVRGKISEGVHMLNPENILVDEGAVIKPGVVLDAEDGPICIGKNARILPNAVIVGPAFIGENSIIKAGAKIYEGTSIGPTCKVGGEVEESIIHSFSNKQHEGFLGHAYLGSWVNIGADSNNSDLKNDYGNVKVYVDGEYVNTGSQFVGLTMGDHSKCGINSMFNTGTVVGVCCNIFGAGLPPKFVPSFSWGGADGFETYRIDKAIEVAARVMLRRKIKLSPADQKLFQKVFELTNSERLFQAKE
jgi:UDP-N-acetylglucosamine diphosphorylase/glucosamine-1-phosphate N-acetyltransferase